ncbi:MAG: hypothetical protein ACO1RX_19930 [Candidatus Sericytochromatia bacterium]
MPIFKVCLKINHSKASFVALSPAIGHFIVEALDLDGPAKIVLDNPCCQPEADLHGAARYYFEVDQADQTELERSLQELRRRLLTEAFDPLHGPAISYDLAPIPV